MNVFLTPELEKSVSAKKVEGARYNSASEVVRDALRLLEEQETKLAALRAALIEGEQSGVSNRNVQDIWTAVKEKLKGTTNG